MNCTEVQDRLAAFVDGELGAPEAAAMQAHFDNCAACAGELKALRAILGLVDKWQDQAQPKDILPALRARLSGSAGAKAVPRSAAKFTSRPGRFLRYAAAILVGIPVGLLILGLLESGSKDAAAGKKQEEALAPLLVAEFDELPAETLGGAYDELATGRR